MSDGRTEYCDGCDSRCCRYFTVPLGAPEDWDDFDAMRWYLLHEGVSIYVDAEGDWLLNVSSPCRALDENGLCKVYDSRPHICRDHTEAVCEKGETRYDFREHFFTADELEAYARRFMARREASRRRRSLAAKRAWNRRRLAGQLAGDGERNGP